MAAGTGSDRVIDNERHQPASNSTPPQRRPWPEGYFQVPQADTQADAHENRFAGENSAVRISVCDA